MNPNTMTVVQCWDDGVSADIRLIGILRKYGARASFNLNAGLHQRHLSGGWDYKGTKVMRLGLDDMREIYAGFTIANHSLTHPRLEQLQIDAARRDIADGRDRLQQFFGQPVKGFAYPFGSFNEAVKEAVRETGHVYARTTQSVEQPVPPDDPMAFHACCHFLAPDFWARYEKARAGGVFYFWGHSYELIDEPMWAAFDAMIARISRDPEASWGELVDLFPPSSR